MLVWLVLFAAAVSGCSVAKAVTVVPVTPEAEPEPPVFNICLPAIGEDQDTVKRARGLAYDTVETGCV